MRMMRDNWIVLGVLAALVAAFVLTVYRPQRNRLNDLREQAVLTRQQLQSEQAQAACLPDMVRQVDDLKQQFRDFDRRLPRQKELGEFIRDISTAILAERLENQVIEPGNPTRGPLYNRLPIILKFEGSFTGLGNFLARMDRMERLTRIEAITVKPIRPESPRLQVELQMNIYFTES